MSQAQFLKIHTKHDKQGEEHYKNTKSSQYYTLRKIQRNSAKNNITRTTLEYGRTIWSPIISDTNTLNSKPCKIQLCVSPQDVH